MDQHRWDVYGIVFSMISVATAWLNDGCLIIKKNLPNPTAWWNVLDFFILGSCRESIRACLLFGVRSIALMIHRFSTMGSSPAPGRVLYPSEVAQKIPGSGGWQDLDRFAMFHLGPEMLGWSHSIRS